MQLWDVRSWRQVASVRSHGEAESIIFSPDGRLIVWGANDKLFIWDFNRHSVKKIDNCCSMGEVVFSPDGQQLASPGVDKVIKLFDVTSRRQIGSLECHK